MNHIRYHQGCFRSPNLLKLLRADAWIIPERSSYRSHTSRFLFIRRGWARRILVNRRRRGSTHRLVARSPRSRPRGAWGRGRRRCSCGRREALVPGTSTCRCRAHLAGRTSKRPAAVRVPGCVHSALRCAGTGSRQLLFWRWCRAVSGGRAGGNTRAAHMRTWRSLGRSPRTDVARDPRPATPPATPRPCPRPGDAAPNRHTTINYSFGRHKVRYIIKSWHFCVILWRLRIKSITMWKLWSLFYLTWLHRYQPRFRAELFDEYL